MYTFEEIAVKIEPIDSVHLVKEKQYYNMLKGNSKFIFYPMS